MPPTEVLLARRPARNQTGAFGRVDVSNDGRAELESIVEGLVRSYRGLREVAFHLDDEADDGEILAADLAGFDEGLQPNAPWSLERLVHEFRDGGLPASLNASEIRNGGWSFYAIRATFGNVDAIAVRAKSPSYGLKDANRLVTAFVGTQLKPVDEPLLAFDRTADLLVVDNRVLISHPRPVERLLVDAEAVKGRAPATTAAFNAGIGATLDALTIDAVQRVCSKNANVARRVERLTRDGTLARVTAAELRRALPDAGFQRDEFGASGPLVAVTDGQATLLVDLAADLYYRPRFDDAPRRVSQYRKV